MSHSGVPVECELLNIMYCVGAWVLAGKCTACASISICISVVSYACAYSHVRACVTRVRCQVARE